MTASAAPTFEDIAAIAAELTGREINRVVVEEDDWLATQIAQGTPDFVARFTLGMYRAAGQGDFAGVDPVLRDLLGREPHTVRDVLNQPPTH